MSLGGLDRPQWPNNLGTCRINEHLRQTFPSIRCLCFVTMQTIQFVLFTATDLDEPLVFRYIPGTYLYCGKMGNQ